MLRFSHLIFFLLCCSSFACQEVHDVAHSTSNPPLAKIKGVSFESPPNSFDGSLLATIPEKVAAEWMAISPFGYTIADSTNVDFDLEWQWWGEKTEGIIAITEFARAQNLKIMLKPQVWISTPGMWWQSVWVGDYSLPTEAKWQAWEEAYEQYILHMAGLAQTLNIELFCIGTEYKIAAVERPQFWKNLIVKVEEVYQGELTYAANWDNYHNISFWEDLKYIGVDSYFPLVNKATPEVQEIADAWDSSINALSNYSKDQNRPILFTEYGYMSVDYTAWHNWENEGNVDNLNLNLLAQSNAFEGMYQRLWETDWWAGGFIWKWKADYPNVGGAMNKQYTPQNKPVEAVIKDWYSKN